MPNTNVLQMGIIKNEISITQILQKDIAKGAVESDLLKLCKSVAGPLLSAAAGAAIRYLMTGSTQDPTTALLQQIDRKLDELKSAVDSLPNATAVCVDYRQVLNTAKDKIRSINELLSFTDLEHQENYLSNLQEQQWNNLLNFLINSSDSGRDYYTLISNILDRTYGVTISQILKNQPKDLAFAATENCYANFIKKRLFTDGYAGAVTFINSQTSLMTSVVETIGDITTCSLKVYGLVKVAVSNNAIFSSLSKPMQNKMKKLLDNEVLQNLLPSAEEGKELPKLYTQLKEALVYAPVYICREAINIQYAITQGHKVTISNNGRKKYVGLASHIEPYSNWTYKRGVYTDTPSEWIISWQSNGENSVRINFPGIGDIYTQHGSDNIQTCSYEKIGIKTWFIGVAPKPEGGFAFVLLCPELGDKQALIDYDPWIGSAFPGADKITPRNAYHQWLIEDVSTS